jgi:hypothetical protein
MQKFGFDRANRALNSMQKDIQTINTIELKRIGLQAEKKAVMHLRNQDLGWKPLSERYRKRKTGERSRTRNDGGRDKRFKKMSEKILIATSSYLQAITSWVKKETVYVGVKRGVTNENGQEIGNIAKVHEYGSVAKNIPARPLWKPTFEEMQIEIKNRPSFAERYVQYFKNKYKQ